MSDYFEMDEEELKNGINSIKFYKDKIKLDSEHINEVLKDIEQNWVSSGEDINSITNEMKNQILKLQNLESSLNELCDALSYLHE